MEAYWLLAEGAAIAGPPVAATAYALSGRRRMRKLIREPLFWEGGRPISLVTLYTEFNGEVDLSGSLRELFGGEGPLGVKDVERAVRALQADRELCRKLLVDLGCEVVLKRNVAASNPGDSAGLETLNQMNIQSEQLGFFAFVASLDGMRGARGPALLPIVGLLSNGSGASSGPVYTGGSGMSGLLDALGLARQGGWMPVITKAVEGMVRGWQLKSLKDQRERALTLLGTATAEALRSASSAGAQLRKNVYSPMDAYMNLAARAEQKGAPPARKGWLAPSLEGELRREFITHVHQATAVIRERCAMLEGVLLGKQGPAAAGDVVFRHRDALLAGVPADALPLAEVEAAEEALKRAETEADIR